MAKLIFLSVWLCEETAVSVQQKQPNDGFCLFKSIFELHFALFGAVAVVSKVLPEGMMELLGNLLPNIFINKNFLIQFYF